MTPDVSSRLSDGALYFWLARAVVRVRGADARTFLHRMSTQHVEALAPAEARLNAFTNKQGRLVELVHQVSVTDDEVLLFGTKAEGAPLISWLDDFVFVEKVELEDLTRERTVLWVSGAQATDALRGLGVLRAPLAPWAASLTEELIAVRTFDLVGREGATPSYLLWAATGDLGGLAARLEEAGVQHASGEDYEIARIAAGVPGAAEVSDRYNPLELALHDAIHWAKGCYIGQEVIARIDNYGKQARQLVRLTVAGGRLSPGDEVRVADRPVGEVTSVSPADDADATALAMVKVKGDLAGVALEVASADGARAARVLPRLAAQTPHD